MSTAGRQWWLAALAFTLCALPSLSLPLMFDDWFHRGVFGPPAIDPAYARYFEGWTHADGTRSGFAFASGTPSTEALIASGVLPWWSDPDFTLQFFRPITDASHALDYQVVGDVAWAQRLHSYGWFLVLLGVLGWVYRRVLPPGIALLALLLFAVDDAHWFSTVWVANRNAVLSAVAGSLAMASILATPRWSGPVGAGAALAVALGCGESGLGAVAMYGVLAVHLGRSRPVWWRGLAAGCGVGVLTSWAVLYTAGAYGAQGSGLYLDLRRDPLGFVSAAPARLLAHCGALIGGWPVDLWLLPGGPQGVVALGTAASVVALWAWWRLRGRLTESERSGVQVFVGGGLLALLPVLSAVPMNRVVLIPSMASAVVIAAATTACWRLGHRWLAGAMLVPHLFLAPIAWWGSALFAWSVSGVLDQAQQTQTARDCIVVTAPDMVLGIYDPVQRAIEGRPMCRTRVLVSMAQASHTLAWLPHRVDLTIGAPGVGGTVFEQQSRDFDRAPLPVGMRVRQHSVEVEVLQVEDGRARRLRLHLDHGADHYAWYVWSSDGYREIEPGTPLVVPYRAGALGF